MRKEVNIEDTVNALDMINDSWDYYLNIENAEIVAVPNSYEFVDDIHAYEQLIYDIEDSDLYIRLPDQYDIQEYQIMKDFAYSLTDLQHQERLLNVLNSRKPYKNFKDEIFYLGIRENYFAFRVQAFRVIAEKWCEKNGILYLTIS